MASDIRLDEYVLVLEADHRVDVKAADIVLDHPARRRAGAGGFRRALVHNQNDGLTINFNGDYPSGVVIQGKIRIDLRMPSVIPTPGEFSFPEVMEDVFAKLSEPESPETDLAREIRRLRRAVIALNERVRQLEERG